MSWSGRAIVCDDCLTEYPAVRAERGVVYGNTREAAEVDGWKVAHTNNADAYDHCPHCLAVALLWRP